MKKHLKSFVVIGLVVLISCSGSLAKSISANAGTSAFSFLKINIGARSCAMGGAFTGLADDETALYYNPAGIAGLDGKRFILEYHNYITDIQSGFVGFIKPVMRDKMLGISIDYLNYGHFVSNDLYGEELGTFGGSDIVMSGTFAMNCKREISLGVTAKFIYEKVENYSATGIAVDLGAKYASDRARYTAGVMIQNLGAQLSALGQEKDRLPLSLRIGGGIRPVGLDMKVVADLILPVDNKASIAIGTEYLRLKPLYVRLGWNSFGSNYRVEGSDDKWAGFSMGVGLDYRKMQFSYAYTPSADLGESHRITLAGGF